MPKYLPPLSTLIAVENIPGSLGFIQGGINSIFSHLYFKDLQVDRSASGDEVFYSLTLVSFKKLGIDIPGTDGMALVLNPGFTDGGTSEFPIFAGYQWQILKYLHGFDLSSFDFSPRAIYELLLYISGAGNAAILKSLLNIFYGSEDDEDVDEQDPIQRFVEDFNATHNPATPLVKSSDPNEAVVIEDLLLQLVSNGNSFDFIEIVFQDYLDLADGFGDIIDKIQQLFSNFLGQFTLDNIKALLIPQAFASLTDLRLAIEFPRSIFQPLLPDGTIDQDEKRKSLLSFDVGSVSYSTETGFEFENESSFDFPKSAILNSDFTLELHTMKLDLSRTKNIPEAIADGRPEDFIGVYVKDATIGFPAFWNHDDDNSTGVIKAKNLLVGTGGFSGTLALEAKDSFGTEPLISCKFGKDFRVSLKAFSITLKQNAITGSTIEGTLVIPGFKDANGHPAEIRIKVAIRQDGDFDITAHEDDGFREFGFGDIFKLKLESVFFGKRDDDFYLGVSGSIKFTHELLSEMDDVAIEKLLIWSDGRFEVEGGTIPLPKNLRFPIGPAALSISAIHLGSHQRINADGSTRNFRYFGFDGGLDVNPGGVDVRGKGIKFYFPEDLVLADCYLEIKSIAIDLVIPGNASKEAATLLLSGFLSVGGSADDPEYAGGVSFSLPKMKVAGGAAIKYRPKVPAFLVDAFVELSTPIPLGATGLGIYGFNGLFGLRYLATKQAAGLDESNTWFDYYKVKAGNPPREGVNVDKLEVPELTGDYDNAFSIGAGVSVATTQDSGKAFSCKLFLLLSLPDLIYLEGKANVLGPRVGLDTTQDPPFFAFLAISSQSVETGFGVDYKLPREGDNAGRILDLHAEMRAAFFFKNSSAWYVNFGTMEKPATARVISLFDATAYLMLSASGIRAGAGVTFGFEKSYAGGLVRASVGVYIKVGGFISFERPQIGGFAMLGGHVDISLMWFSFYLGIDTSLSVEAPKPFYVQGSVHLCVGVTIGFWKFKKEIHKCFDVEFKWVKNEEVDTSKVLPFRDVAANPAEELPPRKATKFMATNMLSGESFDIIYFGTQTPSANHPSFKQAVVPLDSWIDLEFLKGLFPSQAVDDRIGRLSGQAPANWIDEVPPVDVAHKVKHKYSLKSVEIKAWNGSEWKEYRPYQAMSPPGALAALEANPTQYKDGFWQNTGEGFNKLRLLAETSFSYMQQGEPEWYIPEQFGITSATLFCPATLREELCLRFVETAPGTVWPDGAWRQINTVLSRVSGGQGTIINWNSPFGIPRSLVFPNEAQAQLVFNKPCVKVSLKLTTFSTGVVLRFYKRETVGARFTYTLTETRTLTQLQLLAHVAYHNPAAPVAKVEINPLNADPAAVRDLQVRIDSLYRQLYESHPLPSQEAELMERIRRFEAQLALLAATGCTPGGIESETLEQTLPVLQEQVIQCQEQLADLLAEQGIACSEAADFRALFSRCFPQTPSLLSYELFRADDSTYRFGLYDDYNNRILLNGAQQHLESEAALEALNGTLDLTLRPEAYQTATTNDGKYFFRIVDASNAVMAISPLLFNTEPELAAFVAQTRAMFLAAHASGAFALVIRVGRQLPCEVCLDLACWTELPVLGGVEEGRCREIIEGILTARDEFCSEYNVLYRRLYACNKQLLDELTNRCDELTRAVEIKRSECVSLTNQVTAIEQVIIFIAEHGTVMPPDGFPCSTLLHEACCLSVEDYEYNQTVPGQETIEADYGKAVEAIETRLTPVWRPDTKYYVSLQVSDTVIDHLGHTTEHNSDPYFFAFRTAGPLGYFHLDTDAGYVEEGRTPDQYMLTGLKGYIDYRRSYPNADGQLIGAKPLFYEDARLLLFFTKRYVYHFFGDWPAYMGLPAIPGGALEIVIKDPLANTSLSSSELLPTIIQSPRVRPEWTTDDKPRIPADISTLLNLRNPELLNEDYEGEGCWTSGGEMITPASVYMEVPPEVLRQHLKPLKLYTAVVNNLYNRQVQEVHRYGFQTSRFADFAAQVNSYHLDDGEGNRRDAIFQIDATLSIADINLMFDVVTGNMSGPNAALAGIWADPFDRLIEGVMRLAPLDAPISTEFNIIRNSTTNGVVAVWIRSPEPFNDPKLPDNELARSLRVMQGLGINQAYRILFSRDRAEAFVMHPARGIPETQLRFRFAYIQWDGFKYAERSVVMSGHIPMNI